MTRVLRPILLLAALVGALGVLAGCGGGTHAQVDAAEPISFEQLTSAAKASADATSGRFSFSLELTGSGSDEAFSFAGEGSFDARAERSSFSLDLSSFAEMLGGFLSGLGAPRADAPDFSDPAGWKIDAVQDGDVVYLRFPALAPALPAGKTWVRTDAGESARAHGFDLSQLQGVGGDPRDALDFLRGVSDEIETVGREELRGVETTHYRATVGLEDYERLVPESEREALGPMLESALDQSGLGDVPVDVWLDDAGLVRRFELSFSATPSAGTPASGTMSFELWDYGEPVEVELPPADEVVDAATLD